MKKMTMSQILKILKLLKEVEACSKKDSIL